MPPRIDPRAEALVMAATISAMLSVISEPQWRRAGMNLVLCTASFMLLPGCHGKTNRQCSCESTLQYTVGANAVPAGLRVDTLNYIIGNCERQLDADDLLRHWPLFFDPYSSSRPQLRQIPEIMRGLFLHGFTYHFVISDLTSETIEIDGHREISELKSPQSSEELEEQETLNAWRRLKDSHHLYWLTRAPARSASVNTADYRAPVRPHHLDDETVERLIKSCADGHFLWRATHLPYSMTRLGLTEYRIHTYCTHDRDASSTYHIQITMTRYVSSK